MITEDFSISNVGAVVQLLETIISLAWRLGQVIQHSKISHI